MEEGSTRIEDRWPGEDVYVEEFGFCDYIESNLLLNSYWWLMILFQVRNILGVPKKWDSSICEI